MRIVLRRISTRFYYRDDGSWTEDALQAIHFGSIAEAWEFAWENGLWDLEAVKRITYLQDLAQRVRVYFAYYG